MGKKDGAGIVLYKDNSKKEVFLVRRDDIPLWQIPGGGVEADEGPKEAAIRETIEETGLDFKVTEFLGEFRIKNLFGKYKRTGHIYEGFYKSGEFVPEYSGCLGRWFDLNNLPVGLSYYSKNVLKRVLDKNIDKPFSEALVYGGYIFNFKLFLLNPIPTLRFIYKKFV